MTGTDHEDQQPQQPTRINPVAIIAGALASLSAAVIASYFGVAGTLIGAAVVSVVSSLAAAIYAGLLGRGQGIVQRTANTVLHSTTDRTATTVQDRPGEPPDATGTAGQGGPRAASGGGVEAETSGGASPAATGSGGGGTGSPAPGAGGPGGRGGGARAGWSWRRSVVVVGVAAVLIFAIAIGAVSGIEAAIKEPIASALGVRDKGQARTSVGVAVDRAGGSETTRTSLPPSSTQTPASSEPQSGQTSPPTTGPEPPASGGSPPPSTTVPPTTSPPSTPSSSRGATSGS
jgi:hypothetical protein